MSIVLDAKTGRQIGKEEALHINSQIDHAYEEFGERQDSTWDLTEQSIVSCYEDNGVRRDADNGYFLQRDLTYVKAEIRQTKYAIPNGMRILPMDTDVPAGASTYIVQKEDGAGDAVIWKKGDAIPMVSLSMKEEEFPIVTIVNGFETTILERASADFAKRPLVSSLTRKAEKVISNRLNKLIFYGHEASGLPGLLTHPYLPKAFSAVAFDGTDTADEEMEEIAKWGAYAAQISKGVYYPDTIGVSYKLFLRWSSKRIPNTTMNMLEYLRSNLPFINSIIPLWELQGVGPGGRDAIMFWRNDPEATAVVLPQPFTLIPGENTGLVMRMYGMARFGGVRMEEVLNNVLVWVAT